LFLKKTNYCSYGERCELVVLLWMTGVAAICSIPSLVDVIESDFERQDAHYAASFLRIHNHNLYLSCSSHLQTYKHEVTTL